MRIVLLHYAAPPVVGGVESVMGHHARLMCTDGHQVSMLAGRGAQTNEAIPFASIPQLDSRHPEVEAVKRELDEGQVTARFENLCKQIESELRTALRAVDVVIAHNICSLNKNLALTVALHRIAQDPDSPGFILWHHDLAWTTPRYLPELHPGYPWDLLRTDWPGAVQVTVSESRRQELTGLLHVPESRVHVIPNGLAAGQFLKMETVTIDYARQLNLWRASPLLLLPVRITTRKNIELAVQTVAALKDHFPDAALLVTGPPGPHNPANTAYFQALLDLRARLGLQESVFFLAELTQEYIPDEVIADFYQLADALLLPSREEGFGIPVLEAGLAGIPIFCSDIEPLRRLGGRYAGYFSPDADPQAVAGLLVERLSQDTTFQMRTVVKQNYIWQQIYIEKIAPLLADLEKSIQKSK